MVTVNRVSESVVINTKPASQNVSVCSVVKLDKHRRYREEVHLKPRLCPVRYSDTIYRYINCTKSRYVSRTFHQQRLAPLDYRQTTFTFPPSLTHTFASHLDLDLPDTNKRYKTAIQVKGRPKVDINFNNTDLITSQSQNVKLGSNLDLSGPGASQVYIPIKGGKDLHSCLVNINTKSHTFA